MKISGPSYRTLLALLWRSVILLPFASLWAVLLCAAWLSLFALPLAASICIYDSEWWYGLGCLAIWFPAVFLVRWFWKRERSDVHHGDLV
jgi:hypothetical protein